MFQRTGNTIVNGKKKPLIQQYMLNKTINGIVYVQEKLLIQQYMFQINY